MKTHIIFSSFLLTAAAHAGPASTDYTLVAETLDFGGQTVSSADYAVTGSVASVSGISEDSPSGTITRTGYPGQLYNRLGLGLLASATYPAEMSTTKLTAVHTNDDGSNDAIPGESVAWSVVSGPITGIDAAGLASTGAVDGSTPATISGVVFDTPLQYELFVQDVLPDNFGSYAGDGIADSWQRLHFGLDNPLAAALLDPDGDGQSNHFEFVAGLVPTDPLSRFELAIAGVPGEPGHKDLIFSPVLPDRTYTLLGTGDFTEWLPVADFTTSDNGTTRTVTDLNATDNAKFYRVEITGP